MALAPFIGGLIAKKAFVFLFAIGSFFILISSIPLFLTKENYCLRNFTLKSLYKDIISKREKKDVTTSDNNG